MSSAICSSVKYSCNAELAAELHEYFTDEQIAELIFDVMKWSDQKVDVALGMDAPPRGGLSTHSFDAGGRMVDHGPLRGLPQVPHEHIHS